LLSLILNLRDFVVVFSGEAHLLLFVVLLLDVLIAVQVAEAIAGERYIIPLPLVKSYLELNVFECADLTGAHIVVLHRFASREATSSVYPTILIQLRIMAHLDENADLRHGLVPVAQVVALEVYSASAVFVAFRLYLLPDVEVDSVRWVIWFHLRSTRLGLFTLWQISNVQIAVKLIASCIWGPLHAEAHVN
jgi:hypothetical protein